MENALCALCQLWFRRKQQQFQSTPPQRATTTTAAVEGALTRKVTKDWWRRTSGFSSRVTQ
jgi:hypothetical protein